MGVPRAELAEIYLRILLGYCPNIARNGRPCALCQEACDALGYDVVPSGGETAMVTPRGPRGDPFPRFAEAGTLLAELLEKSGHVPA